jgi:hypothetical protein
MGSGRIVLGTDVKPYTGKVYELLDATGKAWVDYRNAEEAWSKSVRKVYGKRAEAMKKKKQGQGEESDLIRQKYLEMLEAKWVYDRLNLHT